ncbi:hypothetical protein BGX38DRAFT_1222555 [Terfezia claveryi]|nr:hypothetical protein BGX38DRAFT_1222555 [Terfezia claveryi]
MELRSNTQRARATTSTVIQRPPISHIAMPREQRESFPGKLIVPNIQTQLDVPSVNITPPPAIYRYSHDTSICIDHHDTDGLGRLDSHIYTPAYGLRQLSVSSYATQCTQRTQSTLQVIPTLTISTTKQHRRRKSSFASSMGRNSPVQFFKRCLRRSSIPGGDNIDAELESQVTESPPGFQYAATPSVGIPVSSRDPDQLVPLSVRYMHPPPVSTLGEKRSMSIRVVGGIKFFEELAKRFKDLFRDVGGWKISMRVKGSKRQNSQAEIGGIRLYTDRGKVNIIPTLHAKYCQKIGSHRISSWGPGVETLRIKNNGTGICMFILTTAPGNPQEIIETPLSLKYLQTQLFAQSKTLIRALEDWNEHFKNPPPHWIINFVPKAYLRRGLHLAEEVAEYLHTYGLNVGLDSNSSPRSAWKVEYEPIGHKAFLVDEGGKPYATEGYTVKKPGQNLLVWGEGFRERHPSRCWERKEGWDGCRGLVIGLAL